MLRSRYFALHKNSTIIDDFVISFSVLSAQIVG